MNEEILKDVFFAFLDLLGGNHKWHDIHENTGLTPGRCKEISELYVKISSEIERKNKDNLPIF